MSEDFEDYGEPPTFETDVRALVTAAIRAARKMPPGDKVREQLEEAVANVELWGDNDDPRQNGWVDDKGRP